MKDPIVERALAALRGLNNPSELGQQEHAEADLEVSGKSLPASSEGTCPYPLPAGVRMLRYERKTAPVALSVYSVVSDPDKFIRRALAELDARLHNPVQIKAGDSVFQLLSKLADCGLELRLEWPAEPETNLHGLEVTNKDIPF